MRMTSSGRKMIKHLFRLWRVWTQLKGEIHCLTGSKCSFYCECCHALKTRLLSRKALYQVLVRLFMTIWWRRSSTPYSFGHSDWETSLTMRHHSPGWWFRMDQQKVFQSENDCFARMHPVQWNEWRSLLIIPPFNSWLLATWSICCTENSLTWMPVLFVATWAPCQPRESTMFFCAR